MQQSLTSLLDSTILSLLMRIWGNNMLLLQLPLDMYKRLPMDIKIVLHPCSSHDEYDVFHWLYYCFYQRHLWGGTSCHYWWGPTLCKPSWFLHSSWQMSLCCSRSWINIEHIITSDGIKPQPKKVSAILNIYCQSMPKQFCQFIDLVNYYHDRIHHLSHLLAPMMSHEPKIKNILIGMIYLGEISKHSSLSLPKTVF